jgi:hypothetical protein
MCAFAICRFSSRGDAEGTEPTHPPQRHSMPVYATGVESCRAIGLSIISHRARRGHRDVVVGCGGRSMCAFAICRFISRGDTECTEPTPPQRHSMPVYATGVESCRAIGLSIISHRARRGHRDVFVGWGCRCMFVNAIHRFISRRDTEGTEVFYWSGQSINHCLCDMPIHLTRRHGGHGAHAPTPNVIPCRCTPPAWNLPGLAIGRLCGWNQYNVRWS